jgi:hypothetical protein
MIFTSEILSAYPQQTNYFPLFVSAEGNRFDTVKRLYSARITDLLVAFITSVAGTFPPEGTS